MALRMPRFIRRVMALFTWRRRDDDMAREMAFHIDALARESVRAGMSDDEAQREARRRFGSVLRQKERGHDVKGVPLVEDIMRDIRHMARGLRKSLGFTTAVVLTLMLGIGGNTAIFSVIDQLLLRPLPYPNGEQLVTVYESFPRSTFGTSARRMRNVVSPANWLDWQRESRTLRGFAVYRAFSGTLTGVGDPLQVNSQVVSAEFFPTLGVKPLLGRTLTPEDDRPKAPLVSVLSHRLWESRFGSDPKAVGRIIRVNDVPVEIVGVMPPGFRFLYQDVDMWGAIQLDRNEAWRQTAGRFVNVVARLKPGVAIGEARTEMEAIGARLAATYEFNKNSSVTIVPLREELTGEVQTSLIVLYAAVGVLLSIACFNVANLLLARSASRRREIAIRTALGAGRLAIIRQLLVESLLLAVVGGALGVALARLSLDALVAFAPADLLRVPELYVDRRVLMYALGLSVMTGLVVGIVPAILVAGQSMVASIRAGGLTVTHSPRIRQALVICQVAMTVILLCGAGLLVRTIIALNGANSGFDKQNVLTMELVLPGARYKAEQRTSFYAQTLAAIRALPGVESAAAANSLAVVGPPRGGSWWHRLGTPELPPPERPVTLIRVVTPGYFRTLRIPVLRGREFTDADEASPNQSFIVNEAFARQFLKDIDPLAASVKVWMQYTNPYLPIIGVVGDVSEGSVRDNAQPTVFYSHRQMPEFGMTLFVRTSQPGATAAASVAAIRRIDSNLAVTKIRTLEGALAESVARERLNALVSGAFALSGLILASLGLYGLLTFVVAERTKEIGIRIALGAPLGWLKGSVVGGGLRLVAIGAAIGVGAAWLVLRSMGTLLFGVTPGDVSTYAAVLGLLAAVAALASYVPARRAAQVEPLVALRQE
ncbi:MAG TPA: ABC transporter permease [Vicinamibacterales bacterium]|nr:ABC transporter permease [Vicinamibacterales bacterium]